MKNKNAVKIAQDTLAQLDAGKLSAVRGTYMRVPDTDLHAGDLQSQIKGKTCKVCAIGGMFAARVLTEDRFQVTHSDGYIGDNVMREFLNDAFSREELGRIEQAFESGVYATESEDHLHSFGRNLFDYAMAEDRMRLIMGEIIRQGGEFKMEVFRDHLVKVMKPMTALEAALASYGRTAPEPVKPDAMIGGKPFRLMQDGEKIKDGDYFDYNDRDFTYCISTVGHTPEYYRSSSHGIRFFTPIS